MKPPVSNEFHMSAHLIEILDQHNTSLRKAFSLLYQTLNEQLAHQHIIDELTDRILKLEKK